MDPSFHFFYLPPPFPLLFCSSVFSPFFFLGIQLPIHGLAKGSRTRKHTRRTPKIAVLGSDVGAIEAALSLEERGYSVTLFPQWSGAPDFECLGPETSSSLTTATQCAEVTFQGKSWDAGTFMTSEKHIGWLKDDAALLQSIVWGKGSKGSVSLFLFVYFSFFFSKRIF